MTARRGNRRKPTSTRIERWRNPEFINIPWSTEADVFSADAEAIAKKLEDNQKKFREGNEAEDIAWDTQWGIMRASRELIFDVVSGKPVFHVVGYSLNVRRGQLELGHGLDLFIDGDTAQEITEEIRKTLAMAHACNVSVLPNSERLTDELASHYRAMMLEGFTTSDGKGGRVRLIPKDSPGSKIDSIEFLQGLNISELRQPAEFALIREAVNRELGRLSEANRLLGTLELAIAELGGVLLQPRRNEGRLQKCLTMHPILFGLDYRRVIPKHRLGAEFEMDYALERVSGLVDLAEIESSSFPLFTRKGDPSQYLVHAEQQVLDWLNWLERHHSYAREKLPRIMRPLGFVVIGRSRALDKAAQMKLLQRNAVYRNTIQVLTYDDLLDRAKNVLSVLANSPSAKKQK